MSIFLRLEMPTGKIREKVQLPDIDGLRFKRS